MSTERDDDYETDEYDDDDSMYDEDTTYDTDDGNSGAMWASALTALLGLWLVVVPTFFWDAVGADFWNDLIVGAAIVALAAYSAYESTDEDLSGGSWASGINVALGLWLVVAPFVWGAVDVLFWNDIVVGALVAITAGYATFASGESRAGLGTEQRA